MDPEDKIKALTELVESAIADFEKLKPFLGDAAQETAQLYREQLQAITQ